MTGYNRLTELWQPVRAPDSGAEITDEEQEEDEEGAMGCKGEVGEPELDGVNSKLFLKTAAYTGH